MQIIKPVSLALTLAATIGLGVVVWPPVSALAWCSERLPDCRQDSNYSTFTVKNNSDFKVRIKIRYVNLNEEWVTDYWQFDAGDTGTLIKTRNRYLRISISVNDGEWSDNEIDMGKGKRNYTYRIFP